MDRLFKVIKEESLFHIIADSAKKNRLEVHLVGGYLRDLILSHKKEHADYDFAVKRNAINFGRMIAKRLKCGFVVLDKVHGSCRVVYNKDRYLTLDFTDFRGKTITDDLLHRDFTINALSLDLSDFKKADCFYDPFGAGADMRAKVIRQANPKSIVEDPVRILRAFSLSAVFGFTIDPLTLSAIKKNIQKLNSCAFERIREELFKILETPDSAKIINQLDDFRILPMIIPEITGCYKVDQGPYHHLDVWQHSLTTLKELELLLNSSKSAEIKAYLNQEVAQNHKRRQLIKLAALLHDIGKPKARRKYKGKLIFHGHEMLGARMIPGIASRLKLSGRETDYLRRIVWMHLRPGYLADLENLTERALFRFFRDAEGEALDILLVSLADQRSTRGPLNTKMSRENHEKLCSKLIKDFFKRKNSTPFVRLVNGNDLLKLGIPEGRAMGKILCEIEETQAEGKVKTKKEGLLLAKKLAKKISGS